MSSSTPPHQEPSVSSVASAAEKAPVEDAGMIRGDLAGNNDVQYEESSPDAPEAIVDLASLIEITDTLNLEDEEPHVEIDRTQRPPWLEEPLQTTPTDTPAHLFEGPAVKLFIGQERKEYKMPRALISHYSWEFRRLEQRMASTTTRNMETDEFPLVDLNNIEDEFAFVDVNDTNAFEILQNWMETRKIDVQARGLRLTVQQIMTRFLRVFVLGERLSMMDPAQHSCDIYAAMRSHMLRLCEANGDSMNLHFVGLASEGLPKDNSLVLDITHTVCRNSGNRLSKQDFELALTSLFMNHPGLRQFIALEKVNFDLNLVFTEEEQIKRAIELSLVESPKTAQ